MRLFYLYRIEDASGVSGAGFVAEGVQFSDGVCALRWRTERKSTSTYASMADLEAIHEHGGKTRVLYEDCDLVNKRKSQPVIFSGTQCFKPLADGTEELFDGWPTSDYCKISEWLANLDYAKEHPEWAAKIAAIEASGP